jgi:hypothetical protein
MNGGSRDSGECGDMSDDGSGVCGGAAVAQAAARAPGTRDSQRMKRKLSVNVLRTTKECVSSNANCPSMARSLTIFAVLFSRATFLQAVLYVVVCGVERS